MGDDIVLNDEPMSCQRGFQVGGAQVSEKHCGFVINKDRASAKDIRSLMEQVSEKVYAQFGVRLEPEVKMIGEF